MVSVDYDLRVSSLVAGDDDHRWEVGGVLRWAAIAAFITELVVLSLIR